MASKLKTILQTAALAGLVALTGCGKDNSSQPKYTPYNAPRAHTTVGEDIVDADGDKQIDYVVDARERDLLPCVVLFKEGYDKKAKELGYVLRPNAKQMDNQTFAQAQLLFNFSQGYKTIREGAKFQEHNEDASNTVFYGIRPVNIENVRKDLEVKE